MGFFKGLKNFCKYVETGETKYAEAVWGNMENYRIDSHINENGTDVESLLEEQTK